MANRRDGFVSILPLTPLFLFLAVGRCSPLAPSIEKPRLLAPVPTEHTRPDLPAAGDIHPYGTRVISAEMGDTADESDHPITVSAAKLHDFIETNSVSLGIGNVPPTRAVFEIELPVAQIESLNLSEYKTTIVPRPGHPGSWTLSVHGDVHPAVAEVVRSHLVAIHLHFGSAVTPSEPGHFQVEIEVVGASGASGVTGSTAPAEENPNAGR